MLQHILIVDDDAEIRLLLSKFLSNHGYIVSVAANILELETLYALFTFDLIIMDVVLPKERGIDFLKRTKLSSPVIMLTALGRVDDRINGLSHGAEDYMVKPFDPTELLLRIQKIIKRSPKLAEDMIQFGDLKFNIRDLTLYKQNEIIHLTSNEAQLLSILSSPANTIYSRDDIKNKMKEMNLRSIDAQIARLRAKIEENPKYPKYLRTIRGQGYLLRAE